MSESENFLSFRLVFYEAWLPQWSLHRWSGVEQSQSECEQQQVVNS
jgi:hypothetical protein